jgi:hypothetical protein
LEGVRLSNPRVVILEDIDHLRLLTEDHLDETLASIRYHLDALATLDAQQEDLLEIVPELCLLGGCLL